jgi:hypothetical protein
MIFATKWKTCGKLFMLSFILLSFFTSNIFAQTAELRYNVESFYMSSGQHNGVTNVGGETIIAFNEIIRVSEAPWLRIYFKDANLGENSFIIMRSVYDGKEQKLDATSIEQWQYSSAYFNGFEIEIELHVAPFDKNIFFTIHELAVGEFYKGDMLFFSICGPTDDRIASDQHATSRLMSIGCTSWIIPNGHFVSAGHCLDGGNSTVVEFQVPLSLPNGTPQHPGPEDQYAVDVTSKVYVNGGVGNDWGTFEVFPNSVTGLMPIVAQAAFWPLAQDLGPDSIRITGYGVDGPPPGHGNGPRDSTNQTQQTNVGPNAGSSGTTMRYVTDTQGGNSGSPVIDELTGNAVGVHTHGGCSSGSNKGTSFFSTAFWDAVEQGIPVELTSFAATVNDNNVVLDWSTATETNNLGFEVQRSSNGNEFVTAGFVDGNGTVTEIQNYTFTDKNLEVGNYSYRLKQNDYDGTFEYSNVVEVEVFAPDVFTLEQNYPNPFNPSTMIKFSLATDSKVSLTVFDVLGQEVANLTSGNLAAGSHEINFNASNINSGVYFYRIDATGVEGTNFTSVKKMILTK